jgi:probable F420-dependent oxidoreductase
MMRFGLVLPHFRQVAAASAVRDVAQAAEDSGFASLWVTDRAAIPAGPVNRRFGPSFFDPYVTLSYVAGMTTRVRLGASVFVLPFRHPVIAARALASLDQFAEGRLIVGVGAGWMAEEFAAAGVPYHRRGRLTDEYLDAMLALWSSPVASFAGPTVHFDSLISEPRPAQQPHPPIWVGGSTPAALQRTIRYGAAWHGSPQPLPELTATIATLQHAARSAGRAPADIALTTRAPLVLRTRGRPADSDDGTGYPAGTPDQVAAAIHRYAAAGFSEIAFDTFFGHRDLDDATPADILTTIATFARTVLPIFQGGET